MPENPRVSVLVPAWNSAATLAETLKSVQAQSMPAWECIIVDDGSTDGTPEIVRAAMRYDSRIQLFRQSRRGPAAARNIGIQNARSDYLLFLDSDDLIAQRKLELNLEEAQQRPRTLVYSGCTYFRDRTKENQPTVHHAESCNAETMLEKLARENLMPVSAALVPCSVAREINGFDPSLRSFEDWDFWLRCARAGASFFYDGSPDTQTHIRLRDGSLSTDTRQMFNYELLVRMKHRDLPAMQREFMRLRHFHLKACVADLLKGNTTLAFRHASYWLPMPLLARRWEQHARNQ